MTETMQKIRNNYHYLLVFLWAFAYRAVNYLCFVKFDPRVDDFGTLVYPAYLAGYDWTDYCSTLGHYYGYGYYWIFAPLFRLTNSPKALLAIITMINAMLMALVMVILFKTLVKYFNFPKAWSTIAVSVIPMCFEGDFQSEVGDDFVYRTDNEIPLFLIVWLLFCILVRAYAFWETNKKASILWSFLAALVLTWGQTVHERSFALAIGLSCTVLLILILKRKWLLHPVAFFGTYVVGYLGTRYLRRFILALFWVNNGKLKNLSVAPDSIDYLKTFTGIKGCILLIIGNFHSLFVKSYGFICVALVIVLVWIFTTIRTTVTKKNTEEMIDKSTFLMMTYGACILITLAGFTLRWGDFLYPGLVNNTVVYAYKAFCYIRYFWVIVGPIVIAVLTWISSNEKIPKITVILSWLGFIFTEIMFLKFVYPYCLRTGGYMNYFRRALNVQLFSLDHKKFSMLITIGTTMLVMAIITFFCFIKRKNDNRIMKKIGRCVVFLLIIFAIPSIDLINTREIGLHFNEGTEISKRLLELDQIKELPETVHVPIQIRTCVFVIPLYLKEQHLDREIPNEKDGDYLLVTTVEDSKRKGIDQKFSDPAIPSGQTILVYTNIKEYRDYLSSLK